MIKDLSWLILDDCTDQTVLLTAQIYLEHLKGTVLASALVRGSDISLSLTNISSAYPAQLSF